MSGWRNRLCCQPMYCKSACDTAPMLVPVLARRGRRLALRQPEANRKVRAGRAHQEQSDNCPDATRRAETNRKKEIDRPVRRPHQLDDFELVSPDQKSDATRRVADGECWREGRDQGALYGAQCTSRVLDL
jgi:hypothetical protein